MIFQVLWNTLNYLSLSACFFPSTIYTVNEQNLSHNLHRPKMACKWFGEIPSCCSLTLLLGPAWVLLKYFLQTIFLGPVFILEYWNLHVNFIFFLKDRNDGSEKIWEVKNVEKAAFTISWKWPHALALNMPK